ncbi:MAG: hypothetical protein J5626_06480 [Lachnospiraceae bacterium]|nr:hypothetical protein [Lachnospiraceae bacterium]
MKTAALGIVLKIINGVTVKFGWINVFGAIIALLLLIPHLIFEIKFRNRKRRSMPGILRVFESLLWAICCFLMIVNVDFYEFGFDSKTLFIVYFVGNVLLLLAYYITWFFFFIRPTFGRRVSTAVIALLTFCLSGVTLTNIPLIVFASLFGNCHIFMAAQDRYE